MKKEASQASAKDISVDTAVVLLSFKQTKKEGH